jgi:Protein of unknown function (DUF2591)
MKTNEMEGAALDWAVAKCERIEFTYEDHPHHEMFDMHYSTNWSQGGPIIEREWLDVTPWPNTSDANGRWACTQHDSREPVTTLGPTALIAAMRCFVASKLGNEVNIPEVL